VYPRAVAAGPLVGNAIAPPRGAAGGGAVTDPVSISDLLVGTLSGGLLVMCGALYALLFALARTGRWPRALPAAYAAYGGLTVCAVALARAIHLDGPWLVVLAVALVGYLLAPHGIWRLCVATHKAGPAAPGEAP